MLVVVRLWTVVRLVDGMHEANEAVFEKERKDLAAAHQAQLASLRAELAHSTCQKESSTHQSNVASFTTTRQLNTNMS